MQGGGSGRLVQPDGVAVTDNVIAVTDYGSNQVKKYSLQGEHLSIIGQYGKENGQFYKPRGLTFNNEKLLYVVDKGNHRVQVFQPNNTFAFSFGNKGLGPGEFQSPVIIAFDPNNNALVSDCKVDCIFMFSYLGKYIQKIDCGNKLYTYVISSTGYLISGHRGEDNKIKVWSPNYKLIKAFGKRGSKQEEFCGIMGMAMSLTGVIYVAEWNNKRLHVISTN